MEYLRKIEKSITEYTRKQYEVVNGDRGGNRLASFLYIFAMGSIFSPAVLSVIFIIILGAITLVEFVLSIPLLFLFSGVAILSVVLYHTFQILKLYKGNE